MNLFEQVKLDGIRFEVDPEGVQELIGAVVFPLKVYDSEGRYLFTHPVSLRDEFYRQVLTVEDAQSQLLRIFKTRLKEELARRNTRTPVSIQERLQISKSTHTLGD